MKVNITRYFAGVVLIVLALLVAAFGRASSNSTAAPEALANDCLTVIEPGPVHVGDTVVPGWAVPNPIGPNWDQTFNLNFTVTDHVIVRFETWEANRSNVLVNGEDMMRLSGEDQHWRFHSILLDRESYVSAGNKIRFQTDVEADRDDFMFRNVTLVTCFKTVEGAPHHLGNSVQSTWLIPDFEAPSWTGSFNFTDPIPGTFFLVLDTFDNTEPIDFKINGKNAGSLPNKTPMTWGTQLILVNGNVLVQGANSITITAGPIAGPDAPWDDIIIKNVRLYYETRPTSAVYLPSVDH